MRTDKILQFQIQICNSVLHRLDFALVYPPNQLVSPTTNDILTVSYVNYHLSIKPNVPVVIFQLESLHNVGTKIYGGSEGCPDIFHLPPRIYNNGLEDVVAEGVFCVSQSYLEYVIRAKCLNKSIFSTLWQVRQELGLNVIGIENAHTKA
jgi:hypothetical protein